MLINLFKFILNAFLIFNLINNFLNFLKLIIINKLKNLYKKIRYIIIIAIIIKLK